MVDLACYRDGARVHLDCPADDLVAARAALVEGDFIWVGLHDPTSQELEHVAAAFGLHPLSVEDALKAQQRPKLELYDDSLFLTLKTLWYVDDEDAVETGEIHIFLGPDFVVIIRHGAGSELRSARAQLEQNREILTLGPSAVVYAVCDVVVDGYEAVGAALEIDVDEVETSVFSEQRTKDSARIYTLKREIAEMRRACSPLRDPLRRLSTGLVPMIDESTEHFFRDVADHVARVSETIDSLDMLLSTAFEAHLAAISVQQNEDMRKISAGVGLVAVPTLIAGVYGMNFDHMPELHWLLGYPLALLLMACSSAGLFVFFKKSGWL
jgi:magnesium transporter